MHRSLSHTECGRVGAPKKQRPECRNTSGLAEHLPNFAPLRSIDFRFGRKRFVQGFFDGFPFFPGPPLDTAD